MKVEISNGELIDKITILSIKLSKVKNEEKLKNIRKEFEILTQDMHKLGINEQTTEYIELVKVNSALWEIEDQIRIKEMNKLFDDSFIELARSVYFQNDLRAEIKRIINDKTNSELVEEKEYVQYK